MKTIQSNIFRLILLVMFTLTICMPEARAEHQRISASLSHPTPLWYQPVLHEGYPEGCGPVAWTILYGYWDLYRGTDLFPGAPLNTSKSGTTSSRVMAAITRIAVLVELSYRQKVGEVKLPGTNTVILDRGSRKKVGSTQNSKMCQGIKWAQERGFRHSRCFRLRGSEFQKFDHVYRYLKDDKPVIISMSTKGHKSTNHLVVVERAEKIQEKVGSNWRDREVRYFINYGWGGKTGWISSRQVGANKDVTTVTNVYLVDASATPLPEAADANEAWCKDWCARAGDNCKMCSSLAGCGPGYEAIKSFKSATKNWYACRQRDTHRSHASEANREACEQWCRNHTECVTCSTKVGCGKGYRHLKSWTGYGNNWHACAKRGPSERDQASDANHQACQNWCNSHRPECIKCSTLKGCGTGFKNLKSWTGQGKNWHACGHTERREASDANRAACESWCQAHKPTCVFCSTYRNCGNDYDNMKSWTGQGTNWHACKKRPTREQASQSNEQACRQWCASHSECAVCSTKKGCGRGYKHLKSWTGRGTNWHACSKR